MDQSKNEFFCPECDKYFTFYLPLSLNQNYRIHCPNCGHIHYRKVENGYVTATRILDNLEGGLIADIYPMKSSCRDNIIDRPIDSYYYEKAGEGFLHRLWVEYGSNPA